MQQIPVTRTRPSLRSWARHGAMLAALLVVLPAGSASGAVTALVAARVIDGRSDTLTTATVVLVDGNHISAIGDRSIIPAGAEVVELGDATLLLAGWTGVRVMGDADVYYANQDLRRVIDAGVYLGPHITGAFESVGDDPRNVAFSPEELRAAVEEASRHSVPVAAHAQGTEGIRQAVAAGVRSIEHGTYVDDQTLHEMVRRGTYMVPTVYLGDYYAEPDHKLRAQDKNDEYIKHGRAAFLATLKRAHGYGVKLVIGLDLGGAIADPAVYAKEFAVFVEAGIPPMAAIQAGTRVAAELLRWDDRLGTLERGKLADIIAVPGSPLTDISALQRVSIVMIGGRLVKRPGVNASMAGLLPAPDGL